MTSREQILITKEHIAMHTNWFNPLNTQGTLVIKLLKVAGILNVITTTS